MPLRETLFAFGFVTSALALSACGGNTCHTPDARPSYANDGIATLVADHCLACHTSKGQQKQPVPDGSYYNTYAGISAISETAAARVRDNAMPPAGEPKLSAEEKEKFEQWVYCGSNP